MKTYIIAKTDRKDDVFIVETRATTIEISRNGDYTEYSDGTRALRDGSLTEMGGKRYIEDKLLNIARTTIPNSTDKNRLVLEYLNSKKQEINEFVA